MSNIKIPCKNKECNAKILGITAIKTGRYCYPYYNKIEVVKREEYIKISSCDYCGCYGEFYTEIDVKGNSNGVH